MAKIPTTVLTREEAEPVIKTLLRQHQRRIAANVNWRSENAEIARFATRARWAFTQADDAMEEECMYVYEERLAAGIGHVNAALRIYHHI